MENREEFKKVLTEIIQKQMVVLGPEIAILKARNVKELTVEENGEVTEIQGDPKEALKTLIDEYVSLSGLIVKKTMEPLLQKYPSLAVET